MIQINKTKNQKIKLYLKTQINLKVIKNNEFIEEFSGSLRIKEASQNVNDTFKGSSSIVRIIQPMK